MATSRTESGRTFIVCGPPCAGKTTYVMTHRSPGDLVADFDAFAQEAGSPLKHGHDRHYRRAAGSAMAQFIAEAEISSSRATTWIIRCLPDLRRRELLADRLGAQIILLDPGYPECMRRARRDGRPPNCEAGIFDWYRRARGGASWE